MRRDMLSKLNSWRNDEVTVPPQDFHGVAGKSESKTEGSPGATAAVSSTCSSVTSLLFGHYGQTDASNYILQMLETFCLCYQREEEQLAANCG